MIQLRARKGGTRFSVVMIAAAMMVSLLSPANLAFAEASATVEAPTIQTAIESGERYLLADQQPDGSWGAEDYSKIEYTSQVALYLNQLPAAEQSEQSAAAIQAAAAYLIAQVPYNNGERARILPFYEEAIKTSEIQNLAAEQNDDGGWGIADGFGSDVLYTWTVLEHLLPEQPDPAVINRAIAYLLQQQNNDGSWAYVAGQPGSVPLTSAIILWLHEYQAKQGQSYTELLSAMQEGGQYVAGQRGAEGHWGMTGYGLERTLIAARAVQASLGGQYVEELAQPILALQSGDGSWEQDSSLTVLALEMLRDMKRYIERKHLIEDIVLSTEGGDGQPVTTDEFEAFQTVKITAVHHAPIDQVQEIAFIQHPDGLVEAILKQESLQWNTQSYAPGSYAVIVQLKDKQSGEILAEKQASFTIVPTFKVEGVSVRTTPSEVVLNEPREVAYSATIFKSSNVDGQLTLQAEVIAPDGQIMKELDLPVHAPMEEPAYRVQLGTFTPDVSAEGSYVIKAYVSLTDGTIAAETAQNVTIVPPPPPTRVDGEQSITPDYLYPGYNDITASVTLQGLGLPTTPERQPLDMVYVLDVSGSMAGTPIVKAKEASKQLLELIQENDQGAVVFFESSARLIQSLTSDVTLLTSAIDKAYASGGTAIHSGISAARAALSNSEPDREKIIVLLSDGQSTRTSAIQEARRAAEEGITIFTLGLGSVDQYLMQTIADETGGLYQYSPTPEQLEEIINEIGGEIFNTAGTDVKLTTTIPAGIAVDLSKTSPLPASMTVLPDGSTQLVWNKDLIVMGQEVPIQIGLYGEQFESGTTALITTGTQIEYTNKNGLPEIIKLDDMKLNVTNAVKPEVSADKEVYSANEPVTISATVTNLMEAAADVEAKVEILDGEGRQVAEVARYTITGLEKVQTDEQSFVWNTGSTYSGSYTLRLSIEDSRGITAVSETVFTISSNGSLSLSTVPNKTEYAPGEAVALLHSLENASLNHDLKQVSLLVTIVDEQGAEVWADAIEVGYMSPDEQVSKQSLWSDVQAPAGLYTVIARAVDISGAEASSTSEFRIQSTGETGYGLEATVDVDKRTLFYGESATISYTFNNSGNAALTDASYQILLVDPEQQGAIVRTFEGPLQLGAGESAGGHYALDTDGLDVGPYMIVLQATLPNGEVRTLATTAFTIAISLAIDASVDNQSTRLLVWSEDPSRRQRLNQILPALQGDDYTIVTDSESFIRELRSGSYNVYFIADTQTGLPAQLDQELIGKLHAGAGVITTPAANMNNYKTFETIGAKLHGVEQVREGQWQSSAWTDITAAYSGKGDKLTITTASVVAEWAVSAKKGGSSTPAVTLNRYGQGNAVHIAFDAFQLSDEQLGLLLQHALDAAAPIASANDLGAGQAVQVNVHALGGPIEAEVRLVLPEQGIAAANAGDFEVQGNQLVWRQLISANSTLSLDAVLTVTNAEYSELYVEYGFWQEGSFITLGTETIRLAIHQPEDELLTDTIEELAAYDAQHGRGKVNATLALLKQWQTEPPATTEQLSFAIGEINKTLHLLIKDTYSDEVRYHLERILTLYESMWYQGGRR
ncbi:VWA domain-containing protein [Paenibacillus soyae]|uniref:VWA domain-containing protein n=1 Tax=Paenibacillus soyae TaxID=2969249 RepID=A0A9X2MKK3_9BACL|nr:VWA domain-containing protein [Paenibacillus soyae]MCR2803638.1 VWA domain-containing protein [Paenibacillus soyae]